MKKIKFCPKCMNIIHKNDTVCSSCGLSVEDIKEDQIEIVKPLKKKEKEVIKDENGNVLSKKQIKKLEESKSIDFEKAFSDDEHDSNEVSDLQDKEETNTSEDVKTVDEVINRTRKRHKHKAKKKEKPEFSVDQTGEYDINTKDVTFFENQEEYSVKNARGDVSQDKPKWWEIYKWADLMLARRKIKKQVNKAAVVRPEFISRTKMIVLCLLFGWMGGHNFYARNHGKAWTILSMFVVMIVIVQVPVLLKYIGTIAGGFGFVILSIWLHDIYALIFNKYKYRITKMQFIRKLNAKTRAKLGKKYIDIK